VTTPLTDPHGVQFELVGEDELGPGMTEDEALAFLASVGPFGIKMPVVAAADVQTGAMIALVPTATDAQRLALEGFEPLEQLHLTLVYLGDAVDFTPEQREEIINVVRRNATTPIEANAFAVSVFNPGGDEPAPLVLGVGNGGEQLEMLHNAIFAEVTDGFTIAQNHTPWVPHVTLAYSDHPHELFDVAMKRTGPITFDRVRVAFGGDNVDIPLISP
jgi:2'-5' RNA ligase